MFCIYYNPLSIPYSTTLKLEGIDRWIVFVIFLLDGQCSKACQLSGRKEHFYFHEA